VHHDGDGISPRSCVKSPQQQTTRNHSPAVCAHSVLASFPQAASTGAVLTTSSTTSWPARWWQMSSCHGSGPAARAAVTGAGLSAGFRDCCAHSARRPTRRNPPGAPPAGPGQPLGARYAVSSHQEPAKKASKKPTTATKAA
jgi:hypothetical protein